MLNEERVILMTRLASYEAGEGKQNVAIGRYFKSDYIRMQTIKSIIYGSVAFFVIFFLMIIADVENFWGDIYQMDMFEYGKKVLFWYLGFVGVYGLLSLVVYTIRYRKARRNLKLYFNNLKKLGGMYQNQAMKGKQDE